MKETIHPAVADEQVFFYGNNRWLSLFLIRKYFSPFSAA